MRDGCARIGCVILLMLFAFVIAVPVAFLVGLYADQNRPDSWYLEQIEKRLNTELGEGEWGSIELLEFSPYRDYHLEAAVRLHDSSDEDLLAGLPDAGAWRATPYEDAQLLAELRGMGAVSEELREKMCSAINAQGNICYSLILRNAYMPVRIDVCVIDRQAAMLYFIGLDF